MNGKILIILPTKDRLDDFTIFAESWKRTTEGHSDIVVGIDEGDTTYDIVKDKYPFTFETTTHTTPLAILNELAVKYCNEYSYICFMEDDCNFNTDGWENIFIHKLEELGDNGIVWGNDLINGASLVGLPFMNSKIIQRLGYMTPPELKYLWADHFWIRLGRVLNSLHYFPDVIVEHRHYSTGKREKDDVSLRIDNGGAKEPSIFTNYINTRFAEDVEKLKC